MPEKRRWRKIVSENPVHKKPGFPRTDKYRKLVNSVGWLRDEQEEGKREMEEQASKLYEDYEAAKLRVQLDEHLTKVEKVREITRLTHELQEEEQERVARIRWEIIAGFEAREASEGESVKLEPEGD
jgi:hypothetical protein